MITKFFSSLRVYAGLVACGLTPLFSMPVQAADKAQTLPKPQTLTGTITLGSGRFALETPDGKVISFMGKGGNKVFAKCRNGDRCEITGTVIFNTRLPLFITIDKVKKLGHAASGKTSGSKAGGAAAPKTDTVPSGPANEATSTPKPKPERQPMNREQEPDEKQELIESPLLPEAPDKPAGQTATPQ